MKMNYCDFAHTFVNVESIHTLILSTSLPNVSVLKCMNVCGVCPCVCVYICLYIERSNACGSVVWVSSLTHVYLHKEKCLGCHWFALLTV